MELYKNSNARQRWRRRRTYVRPNVRIVILPVCRKLDDGMSPGRLVAIAEWREAK